MHLHTHEARHAPPEMSNALKWALGINLAFVGVEFVGGYIAQSLALISDAVHNLTDVPSMSLSLFALYAQRRPADPQRTYGYQRSGVLAAFVNGLVLVGVALYIIYEAYQRLLNPVRVDTNWMLWVSVAGIGVNGGIALLMWRGRKDVNLRTVLIHNAGDAGSNAAIVVGALVIAATGWYLIDPVLGFLIGAAVLWSTWGVLKETTHILLEGAPREMEIGEVARALLRVPGVTEVHDVHIWSLAAHQHALSCHVRVEEMSTRESEQILARLNELLKHEFGIEHTTIQFEPAEARAQTAFLRSQSGKQG